MTSIAREPMVLKAELNEMKQYAFKYRPSRPQSGHQRLFDNARKYVHVD